MISDTLQTNQPPTQFIPYSDAKTGQAVSSFIPQHVQLSVVVPTKNEAGNVAMLLSRIENATKGITTEIIFVDDSTDDTPQVIAAVADQFALDVKVIVRPPDKRSDGLGGAVVEGFQAARAPWVCVMDSDLQHPPELLPRLLEQAKRADSDVIVASRDFSRGSLSGLGTFRTVVSHTLSGLARLMFNTPLRAVSDPLTGFFLVRKDAIELGELRPRGFKILLEMLVKFPKLRVTELLFTFGTRFAGKSKASAFEVFRYFSLLWHLHFGMNLARFMRFLSVGFSGVFVNSAALALVTEVLDIHYLTSAVFATVCSTSWNFALTEFWVFGDRQRAQGRTMRFVLFFFTNSLMLAARAPLMWLMTDGLGMHYLLSNLISLIFMTLMRYVVSDKWIWGNGQASHSKVVAPHNAHSTNLEGGNMATLPESHSYTIHGIITIVSEVGLPELEAFRINEPIGLPTVRVRIDQLSQNEEADRLVVKSNGIPHIHYDEGLGTLGFSADIKYGEAVDVHASPLLRHSPHVLYTNLVEPILRWLFVQKGYALVHGACVAFDDKAYMVTAKTDTGKTTTLLQILNHQRRASDTARFISDDLTLVAPDGRVFMYPKPLTLSSHTVSAVNPKSLTRQQWFALKIQSRIHSRGGRRFAFLLTRLPLPMATINAFVQWLIPPPKYHVQQIVPQVKLAPEAKLAGLFVIERGEEAERPLSESEALEILLSNCEDAYGFPPYHSIKGFLRQPNGHDLGADERQIIANAFRGLPATLIRSKQRDWWRRIPVFVGEPIAKFFTEYRPLKDGASLRSFRPAESLVKS